MALRMNFVRAPTAKEREAMRAAAKAKAAKEAQRVAEAASKALVDSTARAEASAAAFPIEPFKQAARFCAAWRECESGADHVVSLPVGYVPQDREGFYGIKSRVEEALAFLAATGQGFGKFFVGKNGERIGTGFFGSKIDAADIPHVFAELAAKGYDAHLAYTAPGDALSLDDFGKAAIQLIVEATLASSFESAESIRGGDARQAIVGEALATFKASYPMPAFGPKAFALEISHIADRAYPTEHLRFEASEQLPDRFAAMWHAERDRYQRILAVCKPRNFLVYSAHDRRSEPTDLYQMRGEAPYKYAKVGTVDADHGGFDVYFHGCFNDRTPSAEVLAFVSCRLAATGRWLALVPHQDDAVSPDIIGLIHDGIPTEE